ncbi:MAG: PaaI family thioesterase [Chloroflexi bacterium]|nr:PaaI family thioesterase [Chloroflexota bacterium]
MSEAKRESARTRTVTWHDPRVSARDATRISGLDYLRAIVEGKIAPPPIANLIGYRLAEAEIGRVVFELEPAEYHYNPFASVHGGIASTVLDSAMTSAILSTLPIGVACSTLEMKVNFVRPIFGDTGLVRCEAKTIHAGSRIATAEGKVVDAQGKLYAHAVTTCIVFKTRMEDKRD